MPRRPGHHNRRHPRPSPRLEGRSRGIPQRIRHRNQTPPSPRRAVQRRRHPEGRLRGSKKTARGRDNGLKGKEKENIDTLSQRTSTLNTQLRQIQTHLAGNKMLHSSGEFDDTNYKAASDAIDSGLLRAMAEKKDVETIYSYLQKLDATQAPPAAQQPQPIPQVPPTTTTTSPSRDPVLVLHVRET